MKYKELQEPCRSCLGCIRLEDVNFIGDKNCKYKPQPIQEIKQILGIQIKFTILRKIIVEDLRIWIKLLNRQLLDRGRRWSIQ